MSAKQSKLKNIIGQLLFLCYRYRFRFIHSMIFYLALKLEGGEFFSITLRRIMKSFHDVEIGMYSQGGCFNPDYVDRHTTIGRYCSIARGVRIINVNHPISYKSTHSLFWVNADAETKKEMLKWIPLQIGNDVWIGHGAIILPNVATIGDGAIIAAGSVVNKNVPPYAVVVGYPARVVRYRFSQKIIERLLEEKWWRHDFESLRGGLKEFQKPYESGGIETDITEEMS